MPVTLDQILSATRGRLPDLRARRAAVEREAADAIRAAVAGRGARGAGPSPSSRR